MADPLRELEALYSSPSVYEQEMKSILNEIRADIPGAQQRQTDVMTSAIDEDYTRRLQELKELEGLRNMLGSSRYYSQKQSLGKESTQMKAQAAEQARQQAQQTRFNVLGSMGTLDQLARQREENLMAIRMLQEQEANKPTWLESMAPGIGAAVGSFFGPVGSMVGGAIGQAAQGGAYATRGLPVTQGNPFLDALMSYYAIGEQNKLIKNNIPGGIPGTSQTNTDFRKNFGYNPGYNLNSNRQSPQAGIYNRAAGGGNLGLMGYPYKYNQPTYYEPPRNSLY